MSPLEWILKNENSLQWEFSFFKIIFFLEFQSAGCLANSRGMWLFSRQPVRVLKNYSTGSQENLNCWLNNLLLSRQPATYRQKYLTIQLAAGNLLAGILDYLAGSWQCTDCRLQVTRLQEIEFSPQTKTLPSFHQCSLEVCSFVVYIRIFQQA